MVALVRDEVVEPRRWTRGCWCPPRARTRHAAVVVRGSGTDAAEPTASPVTARPRCGGSARAGGGARLGWRPHAVAEQLGVDAEVAAIDRGSGRGVGHGPQPDLEGGAVGDAVGHERGDGPVGVGDDGRRRGHQRVVGLTPADRLAEVQLVATRHPRHPGVTSTNAGTSPTTRRRGCRRCPATRTRGGRAVTRTPAMNRGSGSARVVEATCPRSLGTRWMVPTSQCSPQPGRQEVEHVPQAIAERTGVVRSVPQGEHLVHADVARVLGVGLEDRDRLPVGRGPDKVVPGGQNISCN